MEKALRQILKDGIWLDATTQSLSDTTLSDNLNTFIVFFITALIGAGLLIHDVPAGTSKFYAIMGTGAGIAAIAILLTAASNGVFAQTGPQAITVSVIGLITLVGAIASTLKSVLDLVRHGQT